MLRVCLATSALALTTLPALAGGGCVGDCYRQAYVPPSYGTVTERYIVRAPRTYALTTPAEYRTVHETVQVSPGGRYWSVSYDAHGDKVGCWVTTPPRFASVARTVMVRAPQVVPYAEPAQYGLRSHTVQTSAGYRAWVPLGGGYSGGYASRGYGAAGFGSAGYGRTAGAGYGAGPSTAGGDEAEF